MINCVTRGASCENNSRNSPASQLALLPPPLLVAVGAEWSEKATNCTILTGFPRSETMQIPLGRRRKQTGGKRGKVAAR